MKITEEQFTSELQQAIDELTWLDWIRIGCWCLASRIDAWIDARHEHV